MKVFVTGASGWIGSKVLPELISHGHTVIGLARSSASADKVKALGATPLTGSLDDHSILAKGASEADAVIHLGFIHDFSSMEAFANSIAVDAKAIEVMGDALAKSGSPHKVFIGTSGTLHVVEGREATENDAGMTSGPLAGRRANEVVALGLEKKGIKSNVVRLSPTCHGEGDQGFSPLLISVARKTGVAGYPNDGNNLWSAVHATDAAVLYRLILEKAPSNRIWHAAAENVSLKDIHTVISKGLSLPLDSIPQDKVVPRWGMLGQFAVSANSPVSAEITRKELGWEPKEYTLLEDLGKEWYLQGESKVYADLA